MKFIRLLVTLSYLFIFGSCSKSDIEVLENKQIYTSMLTFNNVNELLSMTNKISKMSYDEFSKFEEVNNFRSLGRKVDNFYDKVDFNNFISKEDLLEFVNSNSNFITINESKDELSIEPYHIGNLYRYIANEEGLFAIKDTVYKIVNNGFVTTDKVNINELLKIPINYHNTVNSNSKFNYIPFDIKTYIKTKNIDGSEVIARSVQRSGRDRIVMKIESVAVAFNDIITYEVTVTASPQKKLFGFWHATSRTISYDFYIKAIIENSKRRELIEKGERFGRRVEYLLYGGVGAPQLKLESFNCWATTPSVNFNRAQILYPNM